MIKILRLTLRPVERFLAQWLAVSTEPSAFVRERIRLRDSTNFLRATGFFLSAISFAFLAEVATLYLLGIGNLTEPFFWLFIVLTSIPFVLISFVLVSRVAPLSLKDVLHLSFYPIGAGVFAGAVFALVASTVVGLLVSSGYITDIKYDFTQWGEERQLFAVNMQALRDCQKEQGLAYTILAAGLGEAYTGLKDPLDELSWLRPTIAVLYLVIAARFFTAAVDQRKTVVFGMALLAAFIGTGANLLSLKAFFDWNAKNSGCMEWVETGEPGLDRMAELALKKFAMGLNNDYEENDEDRWTVSYRSEGRVLYHIYRAKGPIVDMAALHNGVAQIQKNALESYCSEDLRFLRVMKATETQTFIVSRVSG